MPDVAEQRAIDLIRDLRNASCTLRQIAATLTQQGILTKEGATAWTHTDVSRILQRSARSAA